MTTWNKGFVSPGLCLGISFLLWWRAWIWYCSYSKSKLWLLMCFSRVTELSMGPYSCRFRRISRAYADRGLLLLM